MRPGFCQQGEKILRRKFLQYAAPVQEAAQTNGGGVAVEIIILMIPVQKQTKKLADCGISSQLLFQTDRFLGLFGQAETGDVIGQTDLC